MDKHPVTVETPYGVVTPHWRCEGARGAWSSSATASA